METLTHAIIIFVISALAVVAAGIGLARFGDELAEKTGWGALWRCLCWRWLRLWPQGP